MIISLNSTATTNTLVGPILIVAETTEKGTIYDICILIEGTPGTFLYRAQMEGYAKLYRREFDGAVWGVTRTVSTLNLGVSAELPEFEDLPF